MKQSLGRLIMLIVCYAVSGWGATFQWHVAEAPQSLYAHQSGVVRYECVFSDSAAEYTIAFKPQNTEHYDIRILTQLDRIIHGKRSQSFDVLITPKHEGLTEITLNALIRHTTFASIENATIGRDNVKKYDFNDEKVLLPKVTINVKANNTDLTGNISLRAEVDHSKVRAHEPVHLSIIIKGSGNLEQFVPYELNISGVKIFAEPPQKLLTSSSDGVEGEIRQEFALVAEKPYGIPPFKLSVFDTSANKAKILTTQIIPIDVGEGYAISNLLDPPDLSNTATLKRYALYTLLVIFGIMLGEGFRRVWKHRPRRKVKQFWERAKNIKELILMLALSGDKRYEPIIDELEAGEILLGEAKKRLRILSQNSLVK